MKGDNLEGFQNSWDMLIAGLPRDPDPDTKQYCYYMQVKTHKGLTEDIAHYNRANIGEPDHSYDFLYRAVTKYLTRIRQERMREALSRGLTGNPFEKGTPVAPAEAGQIRLSKADKRAAAKLRASSEPPRLNPGKEKKKGEERDRTIQTHGDLPQTPIVLHRKTPGQHPLVLARAPHGDDALLPIRLGARYDGAVALHLPRRDCLPR